MVTDARALGDRFNIGSVTVPTDAVAGAITGGRNNLSDYEGVSFVIVSAAGSTDITDLDLQEHNASTGGTSQDLDIVTAMFYRSETTVDGDELWTKWTQSAASEVTNIGAASEELVAVLDVRADQLSDGFKYVSLNVPDLGTNGTRFIAIVPILWGLKVRRYPTSMLAPLR